MSSSRRTVLCVAAYLVAASLPVAHAATARDGQPALHPKVVEMMQRQVLDGTYRTLVIGVVEDGQSAVFGFGPKGATAPDGQAVYEIGSITKTFTGLLLAQEVTQKRLRPEDPVSRLLPQARVPTFRGQAITLMDLVTQTSALPRLPTNFAPNDDANPYVDYDAAALTSFLASHRLDQRPGERHEYSNLGFGLLGMALSASTGLSYGDMVASRILQPLGMTATALHPDASMAARLVPGHDESGQPVANWDFNVMAPAGGLKSNADDMLRYLRAMMRQGREASSPFALAQRPLRKTSIPNTRIAYAWHVTPLNDRHVVWHNGGTGGYASFIGFTDDGRRGVIVLTNSARAVDSIGVKVLMAEPPMRIVNPPSPPAPSSP